jgi:hypothetical protein
VGHGGQLTAALKMSIKHATSDDSRGNRVMAVLKNGESSNPWFEAIEGHSSHADALGTPMTSAPGLVGAKNGRDSVRRFGFERRQKSYGPDG